jgi:hypothetical protein
MLNDPTIIAASIAAVAAVAAALLSGITQHLFRKRQADQDSLRTELDAAVRDIHFLLEVEAHHCQSNKQRGDDSNKLRIRDRVQAQYRN